MTLEAGKAEEEDAVAAMKLTFNAAMRARDVSRPRPEHLAEAEAAEAGSPGSRRAGAASAGGPRSNEATDAARGTAARGSAASGTAASGTAASGTAARDEQDIDGTRSRTVRLGRTGMPDGRRRRRVSRDSPGRGEPSR